MERFWILYLAVVLKHRMFNRLDDEMRCAAGVFGPSVGAPNLLDCLDQKLIDHNTDASRVPQDMHYTFLRACMIVMQGGVHCVATPGTLAGSRLHDIYAVRRGLSYPSDLRFGAHGVHSGVEFHHPASMRSALQPMADFLRAEFEGRGVPQNLGSNVVLVDRAEEECECAAFQHVGPARPCKHLVAVNIKAQFPRPGEAEALCEMCFGEALQRRERRVSPLLQDPKIATGTPREVFERVLELRRLRHAAPQGAAQAPQDDAAAARLEEMRPVTEAELQEAA